MKELSFSQPTLIRNGSPLFECGEDIEIELLEIYSENLKKTLTDLKFSSGDELFCDVSAS